MAAFANTDLVAAIPEIWSPMVLEELFAKTVLANFVTDLSSYVSDGGNLVDVADVFTNTMSVNTQSTQGADVTSSLSAATQAKVQLSISNHKFIAYIIGDKDMAQLMRSFDFNEVYARKTGATIATQLETSLAALWSSLSTNQIGDTSTQLVDAEVRQAINSLATLNYDLTECAWFLHPYIFWVQLGSIAKYYDASQLGLLGNPALGFTRTGNFGPMDASRGLVGSLYGIPIYTSSNIVSGLQTYRNMLLHKSALAFATQTPGGNKVRIQAQHRLANLGVLTVTDIIYGTTAIRQAAGALVNGSSTFIGS